MLIGIWVLILAAPGFPPSWKIVLLLITGLGIVAFGYSMKPGESSTPKKDLPFTDYKRPPTTAQPTAPDNGSSLA